MSERRRPSTYIEDPNVALRVAYAGKANRDKGAEQRHEAVQVANAGLKEKIVFWGNKRSYDRLAKRDEDKALDLIKTFTRLKDSLIVDTFLEQTAQQAVRIGRTEVGHELVNIRTSSALELYDQYTSAEAWIQKSPLARAVTNIALAAVAEEKATKNIHIISGKQVYAEEPDDPNLGVVEDLYTVLGLRDQIGDIPTLSQLSSARSIKKKFSLPEVGLELQFAYRSPYRGSLTNKNIHEPAQVMLKARKQQQTK